MSELDIISQKAGPLGETVRKDFSDFAGGNSFTKSVKNSGAMGLDDDITGQSLLGKIPSPLSSNEVGGSKLEYPIDVSGNPAYAATIKFQVLEYTVASPGKSQKNHIVSATDNIQSQETTKARVEDDIIEEENNIANITNPNASTDYQIDGVSTGIGNEFFNPSDAAVTRSFVKAKEDAKTELNSIKKTASELSNAKLGFFPKPNSPIINMYFPVSQAFVDGVNYGDANLGIVAGGGVAAAEAGLDAVQTGLDQVSSSIQTLVDTVLDKNFKLSDVAKSEAARFGAAKALNALGPLGDRTAIGQAFTLANRVIVNPNVRKLFNGVIVREFAFQFKMIPTSPEEGEVIQKIIKTFRKELYPRAFRVPIGSEASASLGYNFPNAFKIKFNFKGSENLNVPKILPCYLRNVSHTINPTGGGFKNDGKANEIDLTLNFLEHRAIEQQDIEKGF